MEVNHGYKQTAVGVIPEDWEVHTGEQVTSLIGKGGSPRWQGYEYSNRGMLFVTSENVRNGYLDIREPKYLPLAFHEKLKRTKLLKDDILINLVGASIGRSCQIRQYLGEANVNQAVAVFRVKNEYCSEFIAWCFQAPTTVERILEMQVDAARPNISLGDLRRFCIPIPPHSEQRAIATAFSDVDALMTGLDRLIAKKRDLKRAAMQQLLTGQTRLPGFQGQWLERRLGKIGVISGAGVDKKIRPTEVPVRLLNYMDVYRRDFIRSVDLGHEVSARPEQVRRCAVQRGDIFFTPTSEVRDDIGHSAVAAEDIPDVVYSYHVVRLRLNENWDIRFRAYSFKTTDFMNQASMMCEGSGTRYVITLPKFRAMTVKFPADVTEQTAIAKTLSDMDAEIAALEQRREKTRAIKQGMMQQLLTGRIRLVKPQQAEAAS